ncbi:hypothetical protein ABFS82_01G014100 [Erythranthe guttata]|uniref:Homeobox domain-containing protein n=1 Tax=Erythranthe guttata TaxID=4155 RepID=A0A022Q1E4_ERYGU|nr:PREDICTED: homeobox protein ATH1 [Erythranthe guttata]XP_012857930.1 PREDICTED: homeobox protein ATH1 [Erythranthe guttata]EYU20365.1 hypothetical protein MIMGU_mgv1a005798mg [Erythranthe guttata]|eukprot:XP_012857929.1 PREDICTED: homeobox protein ATH1 [Erythranthe guttata]
MQRNLVESHSFVTDRNSDPIDRQTRNHDPMSGFSLPLTLGESHMTTFTNCNQIPTSIPLPNSHELWLNTQPQIPNIPFDNQDKLVPFQNNYPYESMNYANYEGVPFDASIDRFTAPHQLGNSVLNEWIPMDQRSLNPFSNELSLSLEPSRTSPSIHDQCSSSLTSFSLQKRPSHHTSSSTNNNNNNLSLSCNSSSYKPGSKFFHAMQEILAEIASYALESFDQMSFSKHCFRSTSHNGLDNNNGGPVFRDKHSQERDDVEAKMKHLISLLQLVDEQYNQCLDEIHTVISAFHAVTELDPNLHARFALPTISLMYKNLRERISSCIIEMGARVNTTNNNNNNKGGGDESSSSFDMSYIQKQWDLQQLRKRDHQLWRPQRGLPERSVSVLRAWMFQNFLHPYPKDAEKHLLAMKSGLTRSQVSNWFINARVRLWKPMIEEMCAEMNRRKNRRHDEEITDGAQRNYMRFENRR